MTKWIALKISICRNVIREIVICFELTPENSKREFGGFTNIEKETKLSKKTIITYNQEQKNGDIQVVPAWKYFFETEHL